MNSIGKCLLKLILRGAVRYTLALHIGLAVKEFTLFKSYSMLKASLKRVLIYAAKLAYSSSLVGSSPESSLRLRCSCLAF